MQKNELGHLVLDDKEKRMALQTRRLKCLEGHEMKFIDSQFRKEEFYCELCHESAPLYDL